MSKERPSIAVIGGGTGSTMVARGLKDHDVDIKAIVSTADSGGSTGELRDKHGVLPPGDLTQVICALSGWPEKDARDFFLQYRFGNKHSARNLIFTHIAKRAGPEIAIKVMQDFFDTRGEVIPATWEDVDLVASYRGQTYCGEHIIGDTKFDDARQANFWLENQNGERPAGSVQGIGAIATADLITIAPGGTYYSLWPALYPDGIGEALMRSDAPKVFVANLMNKRLHTDGYDMADYVDELHRAAGGEFITHVLYNNQELSDELRERYRVAEGDMPVEVGKLATRSGIQLIGAPLLGEPRLKVSSSQDQSLIRHSSRAVASELLKMVQ